uniref:Uncharacterized protein n=1 Tax=Solanum lycopersicum TaxID=4081 RepID=A0A3Q7I4N1_SOLLC
MRLYQYQSVEGRQDSIPCLASEEGISEEEGRLGLDRIVRCNSHFIASIYVVQIQVGLVRATAKVTEWVVFFDGDFGGFRWSAGVVLVLLVVVREKKMEQKGCWFIFGGGRLIGKKKEMTMGFWEWLMFTGKKQ